MHVSQQEERQGTDKESLEVNVVVQHYTERIRTINTRSGTYKTGG
jgi:hypothetical protein